MATDEKNKTPKEWSGVLGSHSVVFSYFEGNKGDNVLYWTTNPAAVRLGEPKFRDNPHMQMVEIRALPQATQDYLIRVCLPESKTLAAAEKKFADHIKGDAPPQWYVFLHIIFRLEEGDDAEEDGNLLVAQDVELASFHSQQYRDGYADPTDDCFK